jgi:hypothetical protein
VCPAAPRGGQVRHLPLRSAKGLERETGYVEDKMWRSNIAG